MEEKTLEARTAETILQKPAKIEIGGRTYTIAPPTCATLIEVSEAISRLPATALDPKELASETLSIARDCRALGDIAATLILGARKPGRFTWAHSWQHRRLSRRILATCSPRDIHRLCIEALKGMQLSDFFSLTTFLTEINLTRRKVG